MTEAQSTTNIGKSLLNGPLGNLIRVVGIIVIIALCFAGFRIYRAINPVPYTATKDHFSIVFPGTPTVHAIPSESDGSGGTETGNIYDVLTNAKSPAGYIVYVITYNKTENADKLSKQATEAALETDADQMAEIAKATIGSHKIYTFKNQTAVMATLKPTDTTEKSTYMIALLHGESAYIILGSGLSQSQFRGFANSFTLLN